MNVNDERRSLVCEALAGHMGKDASPDQVDEMAGQVMLWCAANNVNGPADWPAAVDLFKLGVNAGFSVGRSEPQKSVDMAAVRKLARQLLTGFLGMAWPDEPSGPLPPNGYTVTRHNDAITFYPNGQRRYSPSEAVELAVWLIAVADPTLQLAPKLLSRVATR